MGERRARIPCARRWPLAALLALLVGLRLASADRYVDALATEDPTALASAIGAVEAAPTTPELADALFAAGRACEDRLLEPARALAIYERIVRELPDARVATAARRRAERLRVEIGPGGVHAREATERSQLIGTADQLPLAEVVRRAEALARAPWSGAPEAALWLAEHLRRRGRFAEAQRRFAEVARTWQGTAHELEARRGGAGNAIDAGDWELAAQLATALPATSETERVLRDDLLDSARDGRARARVYGASWIVLLLAVATLLGSFVDALLRGGVRRPALRPPIEVVYLAPAAAVLVGISFTGNVNVAPVVAVICGGGLVLAWLSGATLDLVRGRGRDVRVRSVAHTLAVAIGSVALGYIAMVRGGLLDMLVETVKFGPGG
jgi:tetratricopeptide (TPR) repeat protein